MGNILYLENSTNYLKELTQQDNETDFNTFHTTTTNKIQWELKLIIFISLLCSVLLFLIKINPFVVLFPFITSLLLYLISKASMDKFIKTYKLFIELCEAIITFETLSKNVNKLLSLYHPNMKDNFDSIFQGMNANFFPCQSPKSQSISQYEIYMNQKQSFFHHIFSLYESSFTKRQFHLSIVLHCSLSDLLEKKIKLIKESSHSMLALQFDWNKKESEMISNKSLHANVTKVQKIFDMLMYDNETNQRYLKLIDLLQVDEKKRLNYASVIECVDDIIQRKSMGLCSIQRLRSEMMQECDNNPCDDIEKNEGREGENGGHILHTKDNIGTEEGVSLNELEFDEIKRQKEKDDMKDKREELEERRSVNVIDIMKGEREVKGLKEDLISELEEYYNKIKKVKLE